MATEYRWDGPAAMRTCSTAADFRRIAFELRNDSDPDTAAHWALPHHPRPGAGPDAGGVAAALGRLNQTGPTVMSKESIRNHLEAHQGAEASALPKEMLEVRTVPLGDMEIRHSGRSTEGFTIRGYAAVYDALSHDLGGFKEKIEPGAFDAVLSTDPDVHFVWDHNTRYVGARTTNGTLELDSDPTGLHIEAQVGNYSWAKDLRVALERGDINQGSFAFMVGEDGDEFAIDDKDQVTRTIRQVSALYDVTVTAQGAYPQTSMAAVRSLAAIRGRPETEAAPVAEDQGRGDEEPEGSVEPDREVEILLQGLRKRADVRRKRLADLAKRMERL